MKKIDRETVQKIIDTADIVEVVSEFVHLKRRGANYIGLCPFHNERTPSFSVSKAKGICKCFSCGKGGSPVNFIMEHEQLTYWEALRWLARKYNIEIQEHEVSDEERREMSERQALFAANDFALKFFEDTLKNSPDGRAIGMSYFRERGINDWAVERFHLGYSPETRDALVTAARKAGIADDALVNTGLCIRPENGRLYDRFKARVMFPVFSISGKVVAFGGRTLSKSKEIAKYVNSPESLIYSKRRELYGLYQAKQAIVKHDKCVLVEGYMDVISMHQKGVENVVASSGTSLTNDQIRLIHRFTDNVTVIYDSDPAGIKASLRGIDLLLAEGLDIKVVLLPEGDDPDSYAQAHTTEEIEQYLKEHEVDFIHFKTDILLKDATSDPLLRSKALGSILMSIAAIPLEIKRMMYIKECAFNFGMDERVLVKQVNVYLTKAREDEYAAKRREQARRDAEKSQAADASTVPQTTIAGAPQGDAAPAVDGSGTPQAPVGNPESVDTVTVAPVAEPQINMVPVDDELRLARFLEPQERLLVSLMLRLGMLELNEEFSGAESQEPVLAIDFIVEDLQLDHLGLHNTAYRNLYNEAVRIRTEEWDSAYAEFHRQASEKRKNSIDEGRRQLMEEAQNMADITAGEAMLDERANRQFADDLLQFRLHFFESRLVSHPDDSIRMLATDLMVDKHKLSKIYARDNAKIPTDADRVSELIPGALLRFKYDLARWYSVCTRNKIQELQKQGSAYDMQMMLKLLSEQQQWQSFAWSLANKIGDRVYEPLR